MSEARETVFPTRMALTNMKLRLKGAQNGHSLLAKKRDALTMRFRTILKKVDEVRRFSVHHDLPESYDRCNLICFIFIGEA